MTTTHFNSHSGTVPTESKEAKAAAAAAGVVPTLVKLLEGDQSSRLSYELADLLTLLTANNLEQQTVMAQDGALEV